MNGLENVLVETFDGDTPMSERNTIRDEARIIFTNPDMLHITILPQEESWRNFLKHLKYVVVDGERSVPSGLTIRILLGQNSTCTMGYSDHTSPLSCDD